jgi:ABC-2 type transport system ATP-binding protein
MKAIHAKDLSKTYWFYEKGAGLAGSLKSLLGGKKVSVDAVKGINLDIGIGEIVGFIGPNGAGKTTTLKMCAGILYPSGGEVEVMGFIPHRREKGFLKHITFVAGQRNRLFWDLPAEEYFEFCRVVYEIPRAVYRRNLTELTDLAGIGDILRTPQRKLSAGERKRCELVAALLHDPRVIFLDEPTNALDLISAGNIREFIREKGKAGNHTIILTSHNMADIAHVCERVVIINKGKIVCDEDIRELSRHRGFRKQIRVVFDGPWSLSQVEGLGDVVRIDAHEVLMEVDHESAASVASSLFSHFPVKDIGIMDQPLEKIIKSFFRSGETAG